MTAPRRWMYVDQGENGEPVVVCATEETILAEYFPSWRARMIAIGKADQVSEAACLEDWIVVNWAREVIEP